jgi:diaminopimelate decarboxylase
MTPSPCSSPSVPDTREEGLLQALARIPDSNFHWVDLLRFQYNVQTFLDAFRRHYPNTTLAYSYKTNYLPVLIKQAYSLGCKAEVVSAMEYDIAKRIGVNSADIILNGPVKSIGTLRNAISEGAQIHVDSPTEIANILSILANFPTNRARFGIRCCFPIEGNTASQFGVDPDDAETQHALQTLIAHRAAKVCGLHAHFSTSGRSAASFRERTEKLLQLADRLLAERDLSFIDVGGGFFGPMPPVLQASFGGNIPSFDDYAEAVAGTMWRKYGSNGPQLLVEPGAALVADTMGFCTTVVGLKRLRRRVHIIVDGSLQNLRPTRRSKAPLPFRVLPAAERSKVVRCNNARVMGYTCMESDIILDDFTGEIAVGDRFHFSNMGAYTLVFKPPFIAPSPAIYAFDERLSPSLARRWETPDDVLATYFF